jgi:ubiquinone/menaquinone biosynthesis C-methylase UbiE
MSEIHYAGKELELFQHASLWKNYFSGIIRPYLGKTVLEVGAGIGSTTGHLCTINQEEWICLEPDLLMFRELTRKIGANELPFACSALHGTVDQLQPGKQFSSIIYIDVLEHIDQDRVELEKAVKFLEPGGHLIVLVPAHQCLFSAFDREIGHHRRYNKRSIKEIIPSGLRLHDLRFLDSVGLLASLANKYILKKAYPTLRQIKFWDRVLVLMSKVTDPLLGYRVGRSLLVISKR